jgi:hypothetical protein
MWKEDFQVDIIGDPMRLPVDEREQYLPNLKSLIVSYLRMNLEMDSKKNAYTTYGLV